MWGKGSKGRARSMALIYLIDERHGAKARRDVDRLPAHLPATRRPRVALHRLRPRAPGAQRSACVSAGAPGRRDVKRLACR